MQAVPKLSCKAKIAKTKAVPSLSNPKIDIIIPKEATTVPPGTPGAPTAKIPHNMQNNIIVPTLGIEPYNNCDIVITKKVSVKTEPHK